MSYTPDWVSRLQDKLAISIEIIKPIFNLQWGWGSRKWPNPFNLCIQFFHDTPSLYMNGIVFFGIQFPFFVNFMLRWGNENCSPAYVQIHIGWRPIDGRPVIVLRFQSDDSAQGGLAIGFEDGGK
jgi:hypothetical protein